MTGMRDSMRMEILRSCASGINENSENWDQLINETGEQLHCRVIMRAIFSLYSFSVHYWSQLYSNVQTLYNLWSSTDGNYLMMK